MDYAKHYQRLVDRARNRVLESYCERHHIKPRCLGGSNAAANLVDLTAEEHFLAHQLLVKMYPGNAKLVYALWRLTHKAPRNHWRMTNKAYGWIKRELAETRRQAMLNASDETRAKMSAARLGKAPVNKGVPLTDEQRAQLLRARMAWEPTEEQRAAHITRMRSPETRAKMSAAKVGNVPWNKGRVDVVRQPRPSKSESMSRVWAARKAAGIKIDTTRDYKPLSEETKAKVAAGLKAAWDSGKRSRVVSDEAKAKMRAAKLGRKQTPEQVAKRIGAMRSQKGKQFSTEHLANLRQAHARRAEMNEELRRIRLVHRALHHGMV